MITQTSSTPTPNSASSQGDFRILWLPAIFCLLLLSIEIYLLTHWQFNASSHDAAKGDPIASYVTGKNVVRKKTVGTLIWEPPVSNQALFQEDAIATMDDSEAVVVFKDQSELIVEPNSLVILEEAPAGVVPGQPGRIVARLVKGSVKRKGAGPSSLFIKLSRSKDAEPIQIKDGEGHSVFRVMYKLQGYDVVVESGAVAVNGKEVQKSAPKLKAPKLNKPKIEILEEQVKDKKTSSLWDLIFPSAEAAEKKVVGKKIRIRFTWEEIPEATEYMIQVSTDRDFSNILAENRVKKPEFPFFFPAPETKSELFFKVAAVGSDGSIGEFSDVEKVEVNPVKKLEPVIAQEVEPPPPPVPEPHHPAPSPTPVATPVAEQVVAPAPEFVRTEGTKNHLWIWYAAQYDWRKFKAASDGSSYLTSGTGIVPAKLGLQFQHSKNQEEYFSFGGSYLMEKATPDLPAPSNKAFSVGTFRVWASYGRSFEAFHGFLAYHFGPYVSSSSKVEAIDTSTFGSKTSMLFGVMAAIQNEADHAWMNRTLDWRLRLAFLPVGTMGVDADIYLRKVLVYQGWLEGLFCGLELGTRQSSIESSVNGALELGLFL